MGRDEREGKRKINGEVECWSEGREVGEQIPFCSGQCISCIYHSFCSHQIILNTFQQKLARALNLSK